MDWGKEWGTMTSNAKEQELEAFLGRARGLLAAGVGEDFD